MKGKIFNAQEVQSILNKSKVMFREVIKPQIIKLTDQENKNLSLVDGYTFNNEIWADLERCKKAALFRCPYQVGQKIFCKESFFINSFNQTMFKATFDYCSKRFSRLKDLYHDKSAKWKPAQQMKQEHSRITLLIKEIRVERLGEISEEDAIKEGVGLEYQDYFGEDVRSDFGEEYRDYKQSHIDAFAKLWNATHKKPEEKFEANSWVWVVSFEVINN